MSRSLPQKIAYQITNDFKRDNKLPTQKELMDKYFVSRSTIVKAIDVLKEKGLIYSVQGSGMYFTSNKLPLFLEGVYSYDYQLIKMGITIKNELISFKVIDAGEEVAENMKLKPGDQVIEIVRKKINAETGEVLIIQHNFLNYTRFETLSSENLVNKRLYVELYERHNLKITDAVEEITLGHLPPRLKKHVKINDTNLIIHRTTYEEHEICEFTKSYLLTDKIKYCVSLNIKSPLV